MTDWYSTVSPPTVSDEPCPLGWAGTPHWSTQANILVPCRCHGVQEHELDGEGILVDPRSGQVHRLNETAMDVWRSCDGQRTTRQIATQMTDVYEIDFEDALDHVDQLVARFAELNLLELGTDA